MSSRACLINRVGVKVAKSNLAKHVEENNKQSSNPSEHKLSPERRVFLGWGNSTWWGRTLA